MWHHRQNALRTVILNSKLKEVVKMRGMFIGVLLLGSTLAWAGADCPDISPDERMTVLDLQKKIVNDYGFAIKTFKVDDNCYEIYGWETNDSGEQQRVEVYFEMATGEIVKKEVD